MNIHIAGLNLNDFTPTIQEGTFQTFEEKSTGRLMVKSADVYSHIRGVVRNFPTPKQQGSSSTTGKEGSFYSFDSFEEAVDTYTNDPSKVRKFDDAEARLKLEQSSGNQIRYDVVGDFIDIGRALEGVPDAFGSFAMGNPRNVYANIVINLSQVHYIQAEAVNYRSSRILRLVDWLESQGIRCKITAYEENTCEVTAVIVKHEQDAVDLNSLAIVTHGDFLRRIRFRSCEWSKTWSYGYGRANKVHEWTLLDTGNKNQIQNGLNIICDYHESIDDMRTLYDDLENNITKLVSEEQETYGRWVL